MDPITDSASVTELNASSGVAGVIFYVIFVIILWRVFTKAGQPGILAVIPIVNIVFLVKIAGYSMWMALLYLIPVVGTIFSIFVALKLGKRFGKGGAFSFFLLWLFQIIGYAILAFGSAKYTDRD